jgi:hypothetical protein
LSTNSARQCLVLRQRKPDLFLRQLPERRPHPGCLRWRQLDGRDGSLRYRHL